MNFYLAVADDVESVIAQLALYQNTEELFYEIRGQRLDKNSTRLMLAIRN